LICPFDWGLGHASRCVPIIQTLLNLKQEVIVAADNAPLSFLQQQFPHIEFVRMPGFRPVYSKSNSQIMAMVRSIPKSLRSFRNDHFLLEQIIENHHIDAVISDNRFGAWSRNVPCVFMTHQLHIQLPKSMKWARPFVDFLNKWYIKHFDACWIPDFAEEPFLSGKLSFPHFRNITSHRIGILSRFSNIQPKEKEQDIDLLIILSGPEPQRSILENSILSQIDRSSGMVVLLRGLPDVSNKIDVPENICVLNHTDDNTFAELVCRAKKIVCRAGYSTIMDLIVLGRKTWLVPTPGQTEQEYLSDYVSTIFDFRSVKQNQFNLKKIEALNAPQKTTVNTNFLSHFLAQWLNSI
jgi:uncharacterized protein (TIGR00661 family)